MTLLSRSDIKIAQALLCAFTVFYLLVFGGHTYAPDEEMLYYVTQGIVERGSTAIPPANSDLPLPTPRVGADGQSYAITGLLQSVLAIPLYVVGSGIARFFPAPFYSFWTHFFTYTLNSFATGAMAALFYLFALQLGFKRKTALYLTLALGLATILTVYARTFYSESLLTLWFLLAAWAAFRFKWEGKARHALVMGLAVGLGAATKIASLIVLPALALYLWLAWQHQGAETRGAETQARWTVRGLTAGALGFGAPMLAVIIYNLARFHSPFETGYSVSVGTLTQTNSLLVGLYGLLFSSGRSIFAYSPPILLVVWSLGAARRRMRDEALLFLGISVVHLIFYANIAFWWGGGCWGPRYLACVTPFLLLLAGAFLENQNIHRWLRWGSAAIVLVAGVTINLSTLLVNYERYIVGTETLDQQLFVPGTSPIAAQWTLWPGQWETWQTLRLERRDPSRPFFALGQGFHAVEAPTLAPFGRWTQGPAQAFIYAVPRQIVTVRVAYSQSAQPSVPREATFFLNGYRAEGVPQSLGRAGESERWAVDLALPGAWFEIYPTTLAISTTAWSPAALGLSGDPRELGVFIEEIKISVDGHAVPFEEVRLPPPLPVTNDKRWSIAAWRWFHYPEYPHLADVWPWYIYALGLPVAQARTVIVVALTILATLQAASVIWLVRSIRKAAA